MKYPHPQAFRDALDARLRAEASRQGLPVERLRKLVVFDRLIARLNAVAPGVWVVKGGVALELRLGERARTTRDLDVVRRDGSSRDLDDLQTAQRLDMGDFFAFRIERKNSGGRRDETASTFHVLAELGGRTFGNVTIDVGRADGTEIVPDRISGTDLLEFAGIDRTEVLALPLARHVAEKLHAMTRLYGDGGPSTRTKDLIDLVLIARSSRLHADELAAQIATVFRVRATHALPRTVPLPPIEWKMPYSSLANEVGIDQDMNGGCSIVAAFLNPVLAGTVKLEMWDPESASWSAAG